MSKLLWLKNGCIHYSLSVASIIENDPCKSLKRLGKSSAGSGNILQFRRFERLKVFFLFVPTQTQKVHGVKKDEIQLQLSTTVAGHANDSGHEGGIIRVTGGPHNDTSGHDGIIRVAGHNDNHEGIMDLAQHSDHSN